MTGEEKQQQARAYEHLTRTHPRVLLTQLGDVSTKSQTRTTYNRLMQQVSVAWVGSDAYNRGAGTREQQLMACLLSGAAQASPMTTSNAYDGIYYYEPVQGMLSALHAATKHAPYLRRYGASSKRRSYLMQLVDQNIRDNLAALADALAAEGRWMGTGQYRRGVISTAPNSAYLNLHAVRDSLHTRSAMPLLLLESVMAWLSAHYLDPSDSDSLSKKEPVSFALASRAGVAQLDHVTLALASAASVTLAQFFGVDMPGSATSAEDAARTKAVAQFVSNSFERAVMLLQVRMLYCVLKMQRAAKLAIRCAREERENDLLPENASVNGAADDDMVQQWLKDQETALVRSFNHFQRCLPAELQQRHDADEPAWVESFLAENAALLPPVLSQMLDALCDGKGLGMAYITGADPKSDALPAKPVAYSGSEAFAPAGSNANLVVRTATTAKHLCKAQHGTETLTSAGAVQSWMAMIREQLDVMQLAKVHGKTLRRYIGGGAIGEGTAEPWEKVLYAAYASWHDSEDARQLPPFLYKFTIAAKAPAAKKQSNKQGEGKPAAAAAAAVATSTESIRQLWLDAAADDALPGIASRSKPLVERFDGIFTFIMLRDSIGKFVLDESSNRSYFVEVVKSWNAARSAVAQ